MRFGILDIALAICLMIFSSIYDPSSVSSEDNILAGPFLLMMIILRFAVLMGGLSYTAFCARRILIDGTTNNSSMRRGFLALLLDLLMQHGRYNSYNKDAGKYASVGEYLDLILKKLKE